MAKSGIAGCFVAVVGPSGAGKDTILDGARLALGGDRRFHFVRRVITRPPKPDAENHDSLDEAGFLKALDAGAFALHWQAHGLYYGLPASVFDAIAAGKVVVANVSRRVLENIRQTFPRHSIVMITARPEILAERLIARGRETAEQITERLSREATFDAAKEADVFRIDNSGSAQSSIALFVDHLQKLSEKT
ncbi:phosphonate metabolism protein/1,5-bisphosphokinase (PRPP-forming) PhnN [Daeguia caeni]|uniref:Ribose 1,5-bisphosphate phosphokinase PhnN n=1 Tax=Daeguia caeni TaxID=439612 RepID=A0ABV9H6A6_9HYPH